MNFNNLKYFVLSLTLATAMLSGCKDEDEVKKLEPTITIDQSSTPNNSTIKPGSLITIKFLAAKGADGKDLKTFTLQSSQLGGNFSNILGTPKEITTGSTYNWENKELASLAVNGTIAYRIIIEDKDGKTATKDLTYIVKSDTVIGVTKPNTFSVNFDKTNQFFSGVSGATLTEAQGKANDGDIDLTYFFSLNVASNNNLANPNARFTQTFYDIYRSTFGSNVTTLYKSSLSLSEFNAYKDKDTKDLAAYVTSVKNNPVDAIPSGDVAGNRLNNANFASGKIYAYSNSKRSGLIYIKTAAANVDAAAALEIILTK